MDLEELEEVGGSSPETVSVSWQMPDPRSGSIAEREEFELGKHGAGAMSWSQTKDRPSERMISWRSQLCGSVGPHNLPEQGEHRNGNDLYLGWRTRTPGVKSPPRSRRFRHSPVRVFRAISSKVKQSLPRALATKQKGPCSNAAMRRSSRARQSCANAASAAHSAYVQRWPAWRSGSCKK